MKTTGPVYLSVVTLLLGCAGVRVEDTQAWEGARVSALETHPIFLTMPVVKTTASDGTQIWNYVNGKQVGNCSKGGAVFAGTVDYATYNSFTNCISSFAACNNIFFIRDGVVQRYTPVGTGGGKCYTNEMARPNFSGPANIR